MLNIIRLFFVVFFFLFYCFSSGRISLQAQVPGHFFPDESLTDLNFSPDFTKVVTLDLDNRGVTNSASGIIVKNVISGETELNFFQDDIWIYWVSFLDDNRLIAFGHEYSAKTKKFHLSKLGTRNYFYPEQHIYVIDLSDGLLKPIYSTEPIKDQEDVKYYDIVDVIVKRDTVILMESGHQYKNLVTLNLSNSKISTLAKSSENTLYWTLSDNLDPVLRYDTSDKSYIYKVYAPHSEGHETSEDWKHIKTINFLEDEFQLSENTSASPDGGMPVLFRPEDANFTGLYTYHPLGDRIEGAQFSHEKFDLTGIGYTRDTHRPAYVSYWDGYRRKHWLLPEEQVKASGLDIKLDYLNWEVIDTDETGRLWLIFADGPEEMGFYARWDTQDKSLTPLQNISAQNHTSTKHSTSKVNFNSHDGIELDGILSRPTEPPKALIIMPHGGPVSQSNLSWDIWGSFFASRGFAVFQPNFRGGSGKGRSFEEMGHKQWGLDMQTDIYDGTAAVIEQNPDYSDLPKILIGASYGGYAAMTGIAQNPDDYLCAGTINGVFDLPAMLASYDESDPLERFVKDIWVKRMGDPESEMEKLVKASPNNTLSEFDGRVLIVAGAEDDIVPVEQSRSLRDSLKEKQINVRYIELDDLGHSQWSRDQHIKVLSAVDYFLSLCMVDHRRNRSAN